jgi:cyclophilin family peptidyl-prolyl cis-trans isomerase
MSKTWWIVVGAFIVAGVILGIIFISASGTPKDTGKDIVTEQITAMPTPTTSALPPMILDPQMEYTAILNTADGKITVHLNGTETPITVNNFVYLSRKGFYNNTIFHRVIKNFMIQGGDPLGNGTGGPGYTFADEPFTGEYTRGTMAMANAGPDTNGSQFFIMHQDTNLPKNYVIFGKVTNGLDVLDKIAEATVSANVNGEYSQPVDPVKILTVEIQETKLPSGKITPQPTSTASPSATPALN